mgnify:CR=1 FL=1|tara:strand:- start:18253 stop:18510 length:258 start_codon:yes stop_codon:yes gene_type:complete
MFDLKKIAIFYGHVARDVGDLAINCGEVELLRATYPDAEITAVLLDAKKRSYLETSKASFGPEGFRSVDRYQHGRCQDPELCNEP